MRTTTPIALTVAIACTAAVPAQANDVKGTVLRAVLTSPGGELPVHIELIRDTADGPAARVIVRNGSERIELAGASLTDDSLEIRFDHYASLVVARSSDGGATWTGDWTKTGRSGKSTRMAFAAAADPGYRFKPDPGNRPRASYQEVTGTWRVRFAESGDAVGEFQHMGDDTVEGTFLTSGGDFRYLAGDYTDGQLRFSCFDGSHAFLFHAALQDDGTLKGDFWSGDSWHETWTAKPDDSAELPDGFSLAHATTPADLAALRFRDLDGREISIAEVLGDGQAAILEIFGSWCPNCHDASRLLDELQSKYASRGLRVIGIAWEYTGDFNTDAKQLRRFIAHTGAKYPIRYGGPLDREEIARRLPFIDAIKAYPTTIFIKKDGTVTAVHTGFSGPATGSAYTELRAAFERTIERTLDDD